MGYYSQFDIDINIEGIPEATVEGIVERTFGKWIAGKLQTDNFGVGVLISGVIYDVKWYSFTGDVEAFRKAVAEAGGEFAYGDISRQGENAGDGERFVVEDGVLVRQVTRVTWVDAED